MTTTRTSSSSDTDIYQLAYPLYAAVQLLVLVLLLTGHANPSSRHIAESALSLAASLGLLVLSPLAHRRLLSPSALITAYLLARLLCYSLWPTQHESSVASAQRLSTLVLLLLELQGKRGALLQPYARQPPEAVTSFLGNWLFVWVNPVLWKGYAKILSGPDIPVLDHHMSSKALRQAIRKAWDARGAFAIIYLAVLGLGANVRLNPGYRKTRERRHTAASAAALSAVPLFGASRPSRIRHLVSIRPASAHEPSHTLCDESAH